MVKGKNVFIKVKSTKYIDFGLIWKYVFDEYLLPETRFKKTQY